MIWTGEPITVRRAEYTVDIEGRSINGLRVHSAGKKEPVTVLRRGMVTEDKPYFHETLMSLQELFLKPYLAEEKHVSHIDNFLIRLKPHSAHVQINLLKGISMTGIVREAVVAGQGVHLDMFKTFHEVHFDEQTFEPETGLIVYFFFGWHRFLYLDIMPLFEPGQTLDDLPRNLAAGLNKKFYPMPTVSQIKILENQNWFPFSLITHGRWAFFMDRIDQGVTWERIEADLLDEVTREQLQESVKSWQNHPAFAQVNRFAEDALKHYFAQEYSASITLLWPMIEGLLVHKFNVRKANSLLNSLEEQILAPLDHLGGFFPQVFRAYLENIYFKKYEPQTKPADLSRHSLAHGAADYNEFSRKNALIGFLILEQLYQFLNALKHTTNVNVD